MNVLYLEDDPRDAELVSRSLAGAATDIHVEIAATVAAASERIADCETSLARGEPPGLDIVLLDMNLPDGNGLEVLAEIRHRKLPLAAVVLTGAGDEASVLAALRAGADDYLPKHIEYRNQLPATLRAALANFRSRATGTSRTVHLLYVEPNRHDVELTRRYLAAHAPHIRIEATDTAERALARLPLSGPVPDVDVMLIDYRLPGMNALDAFKEIRQFRELDLPLIFITGHGTEEVALQALKLGAADYIVKSPGYLAHLPAAVENAFHRAQAIRENTALVARERALLESEERFRQLAESIREVFWLTDPSHREILYVSPAYEEIWGRSRTSLYESPGDWIEALHPDDRERVMRAVADKQARGTYDEEYRVRRPDGSIRWIRDRAFPVTAADGELIRIAGVAEDVTGRKTAEQALKSNELRKSAILETALDCIISIDATGRIIEFNPAAEKTFGYDRAEALGGMLGEMIVPPSMRQAHERGMRQYQATGEGPILGRRIEITAMRRDGTEFPAELTVVPIILPDQTIFSSHLRDITERKRAEATLRESEAQLRSFVEQAPASIAMFDRDMICVAASRRWVAEYGRGRSNLVGLSHYDVHPDMPEPWRDIHRRGLSGETLGSDEDLWIQADGSRHWLRWSVQPWRGAQGDIAGIMLLAEDITRRKQIEEEIRETRNFLASIFDNIPNSIFVKDARELRFLRVNAACERQTGYSAAELLGKTDHDLFPREQADHFVAKDRETLAGNRRVFIVEEEITAKDGTTSTLRTKKFPIADEQGNPRYLLGMSEDITEQKRAERRLQESESRFRQLIEQASDGIFVIDSAGRFLLANSPCCEMLGYSENELLGTSHEITYIESDRAAVSARLRKAGSGAVQRYERMVRRKDGSAFPAEFSSRMLDTGEFQVIFHDITERRRAEEAIRESESKYRALIEQASDGILITDAGGSYKLVNSRACDLLGYSESEMIGMHAGMTHRREERDLYARRLRLIAQGELLQYERTVVRKNGSVFPADISAKKIGDDAFQFIFRDITERKRAEEQLRASEEKYRQLIEQASDGIFISDAQGNFVMVNTRGSQLLGYAPEEMIGMNGSVTYIKEEIEVHRQRMAAAVAGHELRYERMVRRKDGTTFPAEISLKMLDNGMAQVIFHDITVRRRQEEKIARLNRIQAVLSGINSAIVRIRDRQELFLEACRIASMHGAFKIAWIGLLDAEGGLAPAAWAGDGSEFFAQLEHNAALPEMSPEGVASIAIRQVRTTIDNDVQARPDLDRIRREAVDRGCKSAIGLPLMAEGEVIGVFVLYGGEKNAFDEEEVRLIEELAGDVSFALTFIAQQEQVNYLAYYDTLTGLPNRSLFFDRLGRQLATAEREHGSVALILLDLNRFRMVNDTLGRQSGDVLLRAIAQRIKDSVRDEDTVARTGADRFAIAVSGSWRTQDMAHLVDARTRSLFGKPFIIGGEELRVSATAGVAVHPADAPNLESLVANAEAALRNAKQQNVPLLFYGPEMNARAAESLRLENRLRRALERKELVLWYQPKIDLKSRKVTGMEALMRWQDPENGMVPPAKFIPVMEQTGMILEAGNWALAQIAIDCENWMSQGLEPPRVAVNVSPLQLRQKDFVARVVEAASKAESAGGALDLEITESVIMENVDAIIPQLQTIRGLGVETYIDDFGTGYSSLAYIARLPIHALKIDRSFVVGMTQNQESLNIVKSVISLAHSLKLRVVAEGVETEAQATLLGQLQCDEFQGYLVSKPLPPEQVPAFTAKFW